MTTAVFCLCIAPIITPYVHPAEGWLSRYDELPTVATVAYYQADGRLSDTLAPQDNLIAVYNCQRIGDAVTVHAAEYGPIEMTVFDCANDADGGQAWMIDYNYVGELGYFTAQMYPALVGAWVKVEYHE